ncbi:hypothetical protein AAU61_14475 [Desulfocarbo indianensis]|nr:hypothetical protein AAU61_14475 [Desulfocarbo indianensis]
MGVGNWGGYTSWDQGKTWGEDPNYHFTSDGKNYYVKPGEDPNDKASWKLDTMAGWHRDSDPNAGFEIPEWAYPWSSGSSFSGLPDWGMDIARGVAGRLPGLLDQYQSAISNLNKAPALIDDWVAAGGDAFLKGLNPFTDYMRKPLNNLAARGVFDGTMTRDALTNLGGLLADDYSGNQAKLGQTGLALKKESLVDAARLAGSAADLASQTLGLGRVGNSENYSEDKLSRFTALLSLLI